MQIPDFLKDLGLHIVAAIGAVGLVVAIAFLGDIFNIGFLDSGSGLLVSTIIVMEALFFSAIGYAVATGKI
ncbi:hypothetical protein GKQ38_01800 [Candidatus Nanohaloarchaea archaeon]|nr:hypothetical protein GKQ38_01800 [Candidatus Nanohaloarchaea archaeon]